MKESPDAGIGAHNAHAQRSTGIGALGAGETGGNESFEHDGPWQERGLRPLSFPRAGPPSWNRCKSPSAIAARFKCTASIGP